MKHIGAPIKTGKFYLLDSLALEKEGPWTYDWGIEMDAIVFVSKVYCASHLSQNVRVYETHGDTMTYPEPPELDDEYLQFLYGLMLKDDIPEELWNDAVEELPEGDEDDR